MRNKNSISLVQAVQQLLQQQTVSTQEEICENLQQKGVIVNQVRVSRILNKLGAIKMNVSGKTTYRLPDHIAPISSSVSPHTSLKHHILNVTHNEVIMIIQTSPGSAQLVARLLDQRREELSILATVAGDDTIFIAPRSIKQIKLLCQKITSLLA